MWRATIYNFCFLFSFFHRFPEFHFHPHQIHSHRIIVIRIFSLLLIVNMNKMNVSVQNHVLIDIRSEISIVCIHSAVDTATNWNLFSNLLISEEIHYIACIITFHSQLIYLFCMNLMWNIVRNSIFFS